MWIVGGWRRSVGVMIAKGEKSGVGMKSGVKD